MKTFLLTTCLVLSTCINAQDDTTKAQPTPVSIFSSEKAINANTSLTTGKGKMAFKVFHNFGDIGGDDGGIENFWGLDVTTDTKIGFEIGVGRKSDLVVSRSKGGRIQQLWELGYKVRLIEQYENDPKHPLDVALFANVVVSTMEAGKTGAESEFEDFGDRLSNVLQLIIAKRFGKVSLQLNPTYVHRSFVLPYDENSTFALGGAIRFPVIEDRFNILLDYFHPFIKDEVKDSFFVNQGIRFYDPLGIGFEFLTSGHAFRLNFTNANLILENYYIPRTSNSWGKGQFRWTFTISRKFRLWTPKK